jgi:hypothetical protein
LGGVGVKFNGAQEIAFGFHHQLDSGLGVDGPAQVVHPGLPDVRGKKGTKFLVGFLNEIFKLVQLLYISLADQGV